MNRDHLLRTKIAILTIDLTLILTGCESDDRVVQVAIEAADRQAEQNQQMAAVNREVAAATKRLVTEEAAARRNTVQLQRDVQAERSSLSSSWNDLEQERRQIAADRRQDSFLSHIAGGLAIAVVATLALVFSWLVLSQAASEEEIELATVELLLDEVASPASLISMKEKLAITQSPEKLLPDTVSGD